MQVYRNVTLNGSVTIRERPSRSRENLSAVGYQLGNETTVQLLITYSLIDNLPNLAAVGNSQRSSAVRNQFPNVQLHPLLVKIGTASDNRPIITVES